MSDEPNQKRPFQARWLIVAVASVLALIFLIPFIRDGGARVDTNIIVETEPAVLGVIEDTAKGSGTVTEADSVFASAPYDGVISSLSVSEGDEVKTGDILAAYDEEDLNRQISAILDQLNEVDAKLSDDSLRSPGTLAAPAKGLVKEISADRGDSIAANEDGAFPRLALISGDGLLQVEIAMSEDTALSPEDTVSVRLGEETLDGTVDSCSEDYRVVVTFEDGPERPVGGTAAVLDKDDTVLGEGTVSCHEPIEVFPETGCVIYSVEVAPGDTVKKATPLFQVIDAAYNEEFSALMGQRSALFDTLYQLQDFVAQPFLLAEADGVVTDLRIAEGTAVRKGLCVCSIVSQESFTVEVDIPQGNAIAISSGMTAQLVFSDPAAEYTGTVLRRSQAHQSGDGRSVCTVSIALTDAPDCAVGQQANVSIEIARSENAVLIPLQGLQQQEDGSYRVEVCYGDGLTHSYAVEVGIISGDQAEILKGIHEGDQIVVSSRVEETKVFSIFNHDWVIE